MIGSLLFLLIFQRLLILGLVALTDILVHKLLLMAIFLGKLLAIVLTASVFRLDGAATLGLRNGFVLLLGYLGICIGGSGILFLTLLVAAR